MSELHNLAWAAGIFEGEGCITTIRSPSRKIGDPPYVSIQITVAMVDEDTMTRFHAVMGGIGVLRRMHSPSKIKSGRQPVWSWSVSHRLARNAMMQLLPYLSKRRVDRFAEIMREIGDRKVA